MVMVPSRSMGGLDILNPEQNEWQNRSMEQIREDIREAAQRVSEDRGLRRDVPLSADEAKRIEREWSPQIMVTPPGDREIRTATEQFFGIYKGRSVMAAYEATWGRVSLDKTMASLIKQTMVGFNSPYMFGYMTTKEAIKRAQPVSIPAWKRFLNGDES